MLQNKNPSVATFYTNRALSYLKTKNWEMANQDCKHALEIDSNIVKGHFFLGQALLELSLFDEAITSLTRGMHKVICRYVGHMVCYIGS